MIDPQVALDKLASFETADDLADFLIDQDVHGEVNAATRCPIAQWFRTAAGQALWVSRVRLMADVLERQATAAEALFIANFDKGHYPILCHEEESYS